MKQYMIKWDGESNVKLPMYIDDLTGDKSEEIIKKTLEESYHKEVKELILLQDYDRQWTDDSFKNDPMSMLYEDKKVTDKQLKNGLRKNLIENHVQGCYSGIVEYILSKDDPDAPFRNEDIKYDKNLNPYGNEAENEISEWWAVSDWLSKKLYEHGEHTIDTPINHFWGRETCGQAIWMDDVVERIINEMLEK